MRCIVRSQIACRGAKRAGLPAVMRMRARVQHSSQDIARQHGLNVSRVLTAFANFCSHCPQLALQSC